MYELTIMYSVSESWYDLTRRKINGVRNTTRACDLCVIS